MKKRFLKGALTSYENKKGSYRRYISGEPHIYSLDQFVNRIGGTEETVLTPDQLLELALLVTAYTGSPETASGEAFKNIAEKLGGMEALIKLKNQSMLSKENVAFLEKCSRSEKTSELLVKIVKLNQFPDCIKQFVRNPLTSTLHEYQLEALTLVYGLGNPDDETLIALERATEEEIIAKINVLNFLTDANFKTYITPAHLKFIIKEVKNFVIPNLLQAFVNARVELSQYIDVILKLLNEKKAAEVYKDLYQDNSSNPFVLIPLITNWFREPTRVPLSPVLNSSKPIAIPRRNSIFTSEEQKGVNKVSPRSSHSKSNGNDDNGYNSDEEHGLNNNETLSSTTPTNS